MFENVRADLIRFKEETGGSGSWRIVVRGLMSQGFQALLVYRCFRWFHVRGIPTQPFRFLFERLIETLSGISIPVEADIGKGLRIHHFGGIIFHPHVKMGTHCTLYHGVTLGDKGGRGEPPTIGNNVLIGAGAKVLGDIHLGENAIVGANAVVLKSVSPNTIVAGVPAHVIGENKETIMEEQKHELSKKKICVMQCRSTYTTGGGPDKTVLLSAQKHDPELFEIVLVYLREAADREFQVANWAREKGLNVHEVLEHKKIDWSNFREINRLIKQYDVDIYHSRDYKTCVIGYVLSWLNPRMKLLFTAHLWQDLDSLKMKFYTWLNLKTLARYDRIIAVSDALKHYMIERGIESQKIVVVHNAIDVDTWRRDAIQSTIREEFHIPEQSKIVGVVGRLRYEKDLPTTLQVARTVLEKQPDTYFLIVGDGPEKENLEQQAKDMGLQEKVLFLGFRKDTPNVYAALDVFLSTARTEGTPNTALEALAMEAPVVYTRVGGVGEIIQDGYDGLLFEVGDVERISQAVLSILTDEEKALTLRKNGRKSACETFSFAHRLQTLERIYKELVGAP